MLTGRREGKLVGVIHLEVVGIQVGHYGARDRTTVIRGALLGCYFSFTSGEKQTEHQARGCRN